MDMSLVRAGGGFN